VRKKSYSDQVPVGALAPSIPSYKGRIQERRQKRTSEHHTEAKNARVAKARELNRSTYQVARQTRADQRFGGVADEPAQNHQRRNVTLQLCRAMRGKRGPQDEPPHTWRRQQKRCHQDRIRRPKNRNRIRLEGERKTNFGAKIISHEHAQPDHRQAPLKGRNVYVPRCWWNARGFKRLRDTFHLQQTLWFREPPKVTVAIALCQQPQDAGPCVTIFSH